ncbi:MAG: hypothetical protein J3K34DRAFT_524908, partial [Monoraphidium minutum]
METYTTIPRSTARAMMRDTLHLPPVQRGYAWPPSVVAALVGGLLTKLADGWPEVYLGRLLVWEDRDTEQRFLFDGQQRTVTLCLLVAAFKRRWGGEAEGITKLADSILTRRGELRLALMRAGDKEAYAAAVGGGGGGGGGAKPRAPRAAGAVARAAAECLRAVARYESAADAEAALAKIESKALFDETVVTDLRFANQLFDDINSQAVPLSLYDSMRMAALCHIAEMEDATRAAGVMDGLLDAAEAAAAAIPSLGRTRSNGAVLACR